MQTVRLRGETIQKLRKNGMHILISVLRWSFFGLITFMVLYPLFTRTISMFMTAEDIHDMSVRHIPRNFTLKNIALAWDQLNLNRAYPLTVGYTTLTAFLQMASATMVGYGLARFKFALNKPLTALCVVGLVLPPDLLQIPMFTMFRNFNLFGLIPALNNGNPWSFIDTWVPGLVLAVVAGGFRCGLYILIMRQYFRGTPKAIEEAAAIDGAGPVSTFFRIMLPGAATMMITVFLFSFVWTWIDTNFTKNFMGGTEILVVQVMDMNKLPQGSPIDQVTQNLISYAGILFLVIPLLLLYLFTQRFFVESVERSGLVG